MLVRGAGFFGSIVAALAVTTAAQAQEYCVSCSGPTATYRCVIADAAPGAAQSLQVACIGALARDGGHAQCAIKRGVTVFECDAPVKRVSVGDAAAQPVVVVPPPPPAPDPTAPPATVAEALKRAQASSAKQLEAQNEKTKDALAATGRFFTKTLTCLGSLFSKCD